MDHVLIRELIERYHAAVNRQDWDLLAAVFAEDARWEALQPVNLLFEGRTAVLEGLQASVLRQELLVQSCAGVVIDLISDSTAYVQSTLIEFGREPGNVAPWMAVGFYDDEARKEGSTWRFVRRTLSVRYLGNADLSGDVFGLRRAGGVEKLPA